MFWVLGLEELSSLCIILLLAIESPARATVSGSLAMLSYYSIFRIILLFLGSIRFDWSLDVHFRRSFLLLIAVVVLEVWCVRWPNTWRPRGIELLVEVSMTSRNSQLA